MQCRVTEVRIVIQIALQSELSNFVGRSLLIGLLLHKTVLLRLLSTKKFVKRSKLGGSL